MAEATLENESIEEESKSSSNGNPVLKVLEESRSVSEVGSGCGEDCVCGQQELPQQVIIDFTPTDLDSEFIQRKCIEFWKLVDDSPELKRLMVKPDTKPKESVVQLRISKTVNNIKEEKLTAVSMLGYLDEKGLCRCIHKCTNCNKRNLLSRAPSTDVRTLCRDLEKWDEEHPKCRPICKNRRRIWKDKIQNTSAELLLDRKPKPECFRRWPMKVLPNGPCPLFARTRRITLNELNAIRPRRVVRICQAPIEDLIDTPYLYYAALAKRLGAWDAVKSCCAFSKCRHCCDCYPREYELEEELDEARQKSEMSRFDTRVRSDTKSMRIMYQ